MKDAAYWLNLTGNILKQLPPEATSSPFKKGDRLVFRDLPNGRTMAVIVSDVEHDSETGTSTLTTDPVAER